jgi:hypothetical protein
MEQPKLFRREPTEILAIQWTGENERAIQDFVGNCPANQGYKAFFTRRDPARGDDFMEANLFVKANDSWLTMQIGEWIAKDEYGFYPIQDDNGHPAKYREANSVV